MFFLLGGTWVFDERVGLRTGNKFSEAIFVIRRMVVVQCGVFFLNSEFICVQVRAPN